MDTVSKYSKALVAAAGVIVLVAQSYLDDQSFSTDELVAIATAVGVALGVYQLPNTLRLRRTS